MFYASSYLPSMWENTNKNISISQHSKNSQDTLKILEKLCDYPHLYVNSHFREEDGEKIYIVTISNAEPIVSEERTAIWQNNDVALDIFYDPTFTLDNMNTNTLNTIMYWVNIVCSVLTFRGHEVFLENKLFQPYE